MKDHSIDYVKALKRPFLNTRSIVIGTILGVIPIVNFTVMTVWYAWKWSPVL